ncbi:MAG: hypothetical protein O3A63_11965 [Proteobacteria bacterium]|nr:hypothetical protein [Pseudomonadota bacterium]
MDTLPFFEWLDTSILADISKAYGGTFAIVQVFHLLSMVVLGGMILTSDLRLLGVVMRDVPVDTVLDNTQPWINRSLVVIILTGIFMSSAVAIKLNYNEFFWAKMASLAFGIFFLYAIKRPLLRGDLSELNAWTPKVLAIASLTVWFTVAASGRWIGFS